MNNFAAIKIKMLKLKRIEHNRVTKFMVSADNICPRSSYPFYIVTYYIKWVIASWTDSKTCMTTQFALYL